MAKGHLSEDTIKFIVTAESDQLQQEIHKSGKALGDFKEKEAALRKEQAAVKSALGEESKEYKDLSVKIKRVTQDIADENLKLTEMHKRLGTGSMTMAQLRKEAKSLQRQLDNTSQSLNPKEYETYAKRLQEVNLRMSELRNSAQRLANENSPGGFLKNLSGSNFDFKGIKSFLAGSGIFKIGELIFENVTEWVGKAIGRVKDLITESVQAAREAQGVTHAFEQMNRPDILGNLRKATRGTVSDLELMKAAVRAQDFRLPLDQLGKYLEFAQLKAQQTGQSVDYMTESIIMGLGRQSKQILDNLGISAAQISEEMAKGGDMATAVGRIIDEQMTAAGDHFETAAERESRATNDVANAQLELGNQMQKTFGIGSTSFGEMQSKAEAFILKGLTKLIIYCQSLYDELKSVRVVVETVKVMFDTVFKVCELGFLWLIDTVKLVGRELRSMAGLIEGAFTFDWDQVKKSWSDMGKGLVKSYQEFAKDGKDVGERWGKNVLEGINAVMGKGKVETPKTELDGVTVTGTRKDKKYWEEQVKLRKETFEATKKGSKEAAAALKELKEAESKLGEYNTYSSSKGSGSSSDDSKKKQQQRDADKAAIDEMKRNRKEELSIEQQNYEQIQRLWKEQLAKKSINQQEFNNIMLAQATEHAQCVLDIEKKYAKASEGLALNDANKKQNIIQEQQDNVLKADKDFANARAEAFRNYQKAMEQLERTGMSATEKERVDREAQLAVLKAYYQASLEYAEQNNQDQLKVQEAYLKAKEELESQWTKKDEERKFRARSSAGITTAQEEHQHDIDNINANSELSPEEKNQAIENLEREHQQRLLQIRQQYGLVSQQELYDAELEQLAMQHEQGLLSETEYEEAKKQMKMQKWKESFDYYHGLFSNAVNALQQAELANVDAKYDAEIEAARKAGKDTTKLEEKKAQEQLEIQKKYADVQFAIRASEIIADTAQAIIATHKSLGGWTPWAIAAAALMGVSGAAQLAVAAAERNKVKRMTLKGGSSSSSATGERVATGKEEGGYMDVEREQDGKRFHAKYDPRRRGFVDRPTVIVGEGPAGQSKEWIASNAAVENPTIRPVLDVLDQAQRAGTVRTLDLNKFLLQQRGFAQGGNISSTSPAPVATLPQSPALMERFISLMERLERNGIPASVALDEIDRKNKLLDQSRNIGSK